VIARNVLHNVVTKKVFASGKGVVNEQLPLHAVGHTACDISHVTESRGNRRNYRHGRQDIDTLQNHE
jgi:hypothetical protein